MSLPVKIVVLPQHRKNGPDGNAKAYSPEISTVKSLIYFLRAFCGVWVLVAYGLRRYFPAYVVAIMTFRGGSRKFWWGRV